MSLLENVTDKFKSYLHRGGSIVKTRLFGVNNERLDFIMDSFYKLSPEHRTGVLVGGVLVVILFVFGGFGIYFAAINSLQRDLNQSFAALHDLEGLKAEYQRQDRQYTTLVDMVKRKSNVLQVKPYFEKVSKDLDVPIEGLTEQRTAMPNDNPLASKFQYDDIELRFPKVSIPRLLNFLVETEKSGHLLSVQDLEIRGLYGTKLYFSAKAKVRGYTTPDQ